MKILINYADKRYEPARKWNTWTGRHIAHFDKVCEFYPADIEKEWADEHSEILSHQRGNGLWLWKPYFVNKVMDECADGDIAICIWDNGKGMEPDSVQRFNEELEKMEFFEITEHTGLLSINYRLKQKYPEANLQLIQKEWFGVRVTIPGGTS